MTTTTYTPADILYRLAVTCEAEDLSDQTLIALAEGFALYPTSEEANILLRAARTLRADLEGWLANDVWERLGAQDHSAYEVVVDEAIHAINATSVQAAARRKVNA